MRVILEEQKVAELLAILQLLPSWEQGPFLVAARSTVTGRDQPCCLLPVNVGERGGRSGLHGKWAEGLVSNELVA